jgi:DNA-directed RNA polymerase subunit RPC12/RpoP
VSEALGFLSPRKCFVTPIPELDEAADLVSAAADALLASKQELARDLLRQADMPIVHAYASRVMGKADIDIHRYRPVGGLAIERPALAKVAQRMPAASVEADIYRRDGYRCRFCGCRVILKAARGTMHSLVPDAIPWGAADKNKHAAFYALTATVDHLVPHAKGGDNSPGNLLTTCQPCNFGKGNWLIEEIGLLDPRSRPPVADAWDGLRRISSNPGKVPAQALAKSQQPAAVAVPATRTKRVSDTPSQEEWFAEFDRSQPGMSARLLTFIEGCQDLRISWSLKKVLRIRMKSGGETLDIFGIERTGDIETPWWIGGNKAKFRLFSEMIAAGIPDAECYETPKMWRVRKAGRRLDVTELLESSASVRIALERLRLDLDS